MSIIVSPSCRACDKDKLPGAGSATINTLRVWFKGGTELGGGERKERNWREIATLVPMNDVLECFLWAIISQGKFAVASSTSRVRLAGPSVSFLKSSGIKIFAKKVP